MMPRRLRTWVYPIWLSNSSSSSSIVAILLSRRSDFVLLADAGDAVMLSDLSSVDAIVRSRFWIFSKWVALRKLSGEVHRPQRGEQLEDMRGATDLDSNLITGF